MSYSLFYYTNTAVFLKEKLIKYVILTIPSKFDCYQHTMNMPNGFQSVVLPTI